MIVGDIFWGIIWVIMGAFCIVFPFALPSDSAIISGSNFYVALGVGILCIGIGISLLRPPSK